MTETTTFDELLELFSQSVGVEKAADIISSAAAVVGIGEKSEYTHDEVIEIAKVIRQDHEGYIAIVAHELQVRKQADKRFHALLENIPDPATVIRFDNAMPIVRTVNSAFESRFGYSADELSGNSLNEYIVPADCLGDARMIDHQLMEGNRVEREIERETKAGQRRAFLYRGVPISSETGIIEAHGIYTDITTRKQRERELERKNQRLEQFANVVSHDLRNPLSVARGNLELARETGDADHFEAIADAHARMEELIENLLTLAKQGQTVGDTEPIDLSATVEEAWSSVDSLAATLEIDGELQAIRADENRLIELFENLFKNAVEHGAKSNTGNAETKRDTRHINSSLSDGETGSESTRFEFSDDADDTSKVTVTVGMLTDGFFVADDGPGIPPGDREQVIEQGYTTSDEGTGFGLAIVQSIVNAHGWKLSITESETGGAQFEVTGVERA